MRLSEAIKRLAVNAVDAASPIDLVIGEVTAVSPLSIRLNENHKLIIPEELLIWPKRLNKGEDDELKRGDSIMVLSMAGGQSFYIIDKL
ncbi:DUF2577 family protein [Bacillus sp. WP8]|uniref:DUF2577 family protein n=1 Tax=Bacillus TaxID=1386 RepID=UPI0011A4B5AF|nr:DUF2577 family protein [Bacillus sp. WP8]